tara:strand:+ start:582 stop:836 length:255 start_codon:yes stop_codon:yes gene_type:complete
MAIPEYKSNLKVSYINELKKEREKSNKLHLEIMLMLEQSSDVEEIMKVREKRNNIMIVIETLESRINNIGKKTGLEEQSIPKFK